VTVQLKQKVDLLSGRLGIWTELVKKDRLLIHINGDGLCKLCVVGFFAPKLCPLELVCTYLVPTTL